MDSERIAALKTLLSTATNEEVIYMHDAVRREFQARLYAKSPLHNTAIPPTPTDAEYMAERERARKVPIGKGPNIGRWLQNQEPMSDKTATTLFGNTHNPED